MTTRQEKTFLALLELTTEEAVSALLNWHGEQLLDSGFMQHIIDEGYMEEEDE